MTVNRYDRVGEEIKRVLSETLREMKDPRISPMTTILGVEVTSDLKWAKVRVSVYDQDDAVRKQTVEAMNRAAGFFAHELGQRMEIRSLPKFNFLLDDSIEYSVRISQILDTLNKDKNGGE